MMNKSHTGPEESVDAFTELGGKIFIPMYYGTYDLSDEPPGEPIRILRQEISKDKLKELKVGEKYFFS
jgi:L-ascorbate metabolism protein UlaG (beta-lactamase superfamily)